MLKVGFRPARLNTSFYNRSEDKHVTQISRLLYLAIKGRDWIKLQKRGLRELFGIRI